MSGTPKTLEEAIQNGIADGINQAVGSVGHPPLANKVIAKHVRDFLSQKFGAAMLTASDSEIDKLQALWSKVIGL